MDNSSSTSIVLRKLRPPFARPATLLFAYSNNTSAYNGITVALPAGEPAVAPGSGIVKKIYSAAHGWQTSDPVLATTSSVHVLLDHGGAVTTLVGGLQSASVSLGQAVARGDRLGSLAGSQLFLAVYVGLKTINPTTLGRHWQAQNSNMVTGQGGNIRFAPDRLARDLSAGVAVTLTNGVRYFSNLLAGPAPLLVNIAFNSDGSKTGPAAAGAASDVWNVYTPADFNATVASACSFYAFNFYNFTGPAVFPLLTSAGAASGIVLERVAPLFSAAALGSSFDNMLKAWIGGYLGPVPYENTFRLRNLTAATYSLYLYASEGTYPTASTFYVSVANNSPVALSNYPAGATTFVQNDNYVKYSLTVHAGDWITVKAVGYFSGLQLQRV